MAPKKSLRPKMRDDRPYLPEHEMPVTRSVTPDAIEPKSSVRPKARPDDMEDIVARAREAAAVERGNRGSRYEAEDYMSGKEGYAGGGKVNGFPDLNKDGKVTKADVLKGRGVEGFMGGGMVRGCKASQVSGKGFKGTY